MEQKQQQFVVIGGGPAGLTAAYELTRHAQRPIVLEKDNIVGGIARTGGAHQDHTQPGLRLHCRIRLRGNIGLEHPHLASGGGGAGDSEQTQGDETDDKCAHWLQYRTFFLKLPRPNT